MLYQFRGVMHQVLSGDSEPLRIPKQCKSFSALYISVTASYGDVLSIHSHYCGVQRLQSRLMIQQIVYCLELPYQITPALAVSGGRGIFYFNFMSLQMSLTQQPRIFCHLLNATELLSPYHLHAPATIFIFILFVFVSPLHSSQD